MGISKTRFVGYNHSLFICPLCEDVADDPKLVKCCESIICSKCHDNRVADGGIYSIPSSCNKEHEVTTEKCELQKQLKLLYLRLKVKCSNEGCTEQLSLADVSAHESTCSFRVCRKCGYENPPHGHDCVQWLLDKTSRLTEQLSIMEAELKSVQKSGSQLRLQLEEFEKQKDCGYSSNGSCSQELDPTQNLSTTGTMVSKSLVFNSCTTASASIKNMFKRYFDSSVSKNCSLLLGLYDYALTSTGKKWVVLPRSELDLTKGVIPEDTFCSFDIGDTEIIAFRGDVNKFRIEPTNQFDCTDNYEKEIAKIRSVLSTYYNGEKVGRPNRMDRNKKIAQLIETELGGQALSFPNGDQLQIFAIHSIDSFLWKCFKYCFSGIAINFQSLSEYEIDKGASSLLPVTRGRIIKAVVLSANKLSQPNLIAAESANLIKNYVGGSWLGYRLNDEPSHNPLQGRTVVTLPCGGQIIMFYGGQFRAN